MTLKTRAAVALCLLCFAGNSLLSRVALGSGADAPQHFAAVRLGSGACALILCAWIRARQFPRGGGSWTSAFALFCYAALFSYAYAIIDAGVGAFILFTTVQATMIGWSVCTRRAPAHAECWGLALALLGLGCLTLPGKDVPAPAGVALMAGAGCAWGVYSLRGSAGRPPLEATALNFTRAAPLALVLALASPAALPEKTSPGLWLAVVSGIFTSGGAYTLWYAMLPHLGSNRAAIVQLAVPVLTLFLSCLFLEESLSTRLIGGSALILAGVAYALRGKAAPR